MCLTSELEMGCMVPCSRMGEEERKEGAQLTAEAKKRASELGEKRKEEEEREISLCCLLLSPQCNTSTDRVYMHTVAKELVS